MRTLVVVLCVTGCVPLVAAQENPTIEVASVKRNTSGDGRIMIQALPGRARRILRCSRCARGSRIVSS